MIVVGGEALVDLVPMGDEPLSALRPRLGGGPCNVAVAAGRLDAVTAFLSRVSTDAFGAAIVERLASSGVDTTLVQRGPEPSTLAVTSLGQDGSAQYTFYAEGTADRLFTDPGPLPPEVTMLSLGTLSLVLEPGASAYESVLRREAARGVLTALDPNIRPVLIAEPDAYRARFSSWLPDVALLKLSVEDARWLTGDLADGESATANATGVSNAVAAARSWQRRGVSAVVLTLGSDGLAVLTPAGEVVTVPAVPTSVADTIGAGDTVLGALLAWCYRAGIDSVAKLHAMDTEGWRAALHFAAAAASITVSREGAEPPFAAELSRLF
jgi:fructokinase